MRARATPTTSDARTCARPKNKQTNKSKTKHDGRIRWRGNDHQQPTYHQVGSGTSDLRAFSISIYLLVSLFVFCYCFGFVFFCLFVVGRRGGAGAADDARFRDSAPGSARRAPPLRFRFSVSFSRRCAFIRPLCAP